MADLGHWSWGPAWNKLRNDVNILAWLFEEEKYVRRHPFSTEVIEPWHGKASTNPPTEVPTA